MLPSFAGANRPAGWNFLAAVAAVAETVAAKASETEAGVRRQRKQIRGPQEKMSFFQIASGPILSIPFHLKVCQYDPCKVLLKNMTPSLPTNPPKSVFFWH